MFEAIRDLFTNLHTRKAAYKLLTGGIFLLEAVFAYRVTVMYGALLEAFGVSQATLPIPMTDWTLPVGGIVLFLIQAALFLAVLALGFAYATHRQYAIEALIRRINRLAKQDHLDPDHAQVKADIARARKESRWMMWGLIANDIAAGVYIVIAGSKQITMTSLKTDFSQDLLILFAIAGWTIMVFIPFWAGAFTLALAESLLEEQKETFALRGTAALMDLQEKALTNVLEGQDQLDREKSLQLVLQTGKHATSSTENEQLQEFLARLQEFQQVFQQQIQPQVISAPAPVQPPSSAFDADARQELSNPALPTELDAIALARFLRIPEEEAELLLSERPTSPGEAKASWNRKGQLVTTLKEAARIASLRSQRQLPDLAPGHSAPPPPPPIQSQEKPDRKGGSAASSRPFRQQQTQEEITRSWLAIQQAECE